MLRNSAFRDIWMPMLVLAGLLASIVAGIVRVAGAQEFPTPLAISILWAGYQATPPALVCIPLSLALVICTEAWSLVIARRSVRYRV